MARTIAEIKNQIGEQFVKNPDVIEAYSLDREKSFEQEFSKVSVESIIFYIVSAAIWVVEVLFDKHREEVSQLIADLKPHTLRWYATKAKAFQYGRSLEEDTDGYDNSGLSDSEIEQERVVKYAAVVDKGAIVYVKVATGDKGKRQQLTEDQEIALATYFNKVKDAGVKLEIVNEAAVPFWINMDVHYDPQVFKSDLSRLDNSEKTVHNTIADFVENLPFNGEFRISALIVAIQQLDGVKIVKIKEAFTPDEIIDAKCLPSSGYFVADLESSNINPIPYETVSNKF